MDSSPDSLGRPKLPVLQSARILDRPPAPPLEVGKGKGAGHPLIEATGFRSLGQPPEPREHWPIATSSSGAALVGDLQLALFASLENSAKRPPSAYVNNLLAGREWLTTTGVASDTVDLWERPYSILVFFPWRATSYFDGRANHATCNSLRTSCPTCGTSHSIFLAPNQHHVVSLTAKVFTFARQNKLCTMLEFLLLV